MRLLRVISREIALKSRISVQEYLRAETEYAQFANDIITALRTAIFGETPSSNCGGCCANY